MKTTSTLEREEREDLTEAEVMKGLLWCATRPKLVRHTTVSGSSVSATTRGSGRSTVTTTEVATVEDAAVELMSQADARALTDQIKANADHLWELLATAYTTGAWRALGHESWDDYCQAEFGDTRLQLPREKRKEAVQSMRSAGLTVEAIASATGAGKSTVSRDADGVSPNGKTADGKRGPGRPKGSKNKPKPDVPAPLDAPAHETAPAESCLLTVEALADADGAEFKDTDDVVAAFGDTQLGAVAAGGSVVIYRNGFELDTYNPQQARTLAAALLQAAERVEA